MTTIKNVINFVNTLQDDAFRALVAVGLQDDKGWDAVKDLGVDACKSLRSRVEGLKGAATADDVADSLLSCYAGVVHFRTVLQVMHDYRSIDAVKAYIKLFLPRASNVQITLGEVITDAMVKKLKLPAAGAAA